MPQTDIRDFTFPQVSDFYLAQQRQPGATSDIEELVRQFPHMEREIRARLPALSLLERTHAGHEVVTNATNIDGCFVEGTRAKGRIGVVYNGYQQELDRCVAIKVIKFTELPMTAVERFVAERKAIAELEHPNIVTVHSYVHDKEVGCIIMKLIEGFSLDQLLQGECDHSGLYLLNDLQAEWSTFSKLATSIASALGHAHDRGMFHRGVKPSNILLDKNGNPWLTDFGVAVLANSKDSSGEKGKAIETARYISPEEMTGNFDARSDLYSLGLTLYELALGENNRQELTKQLERSMSRPSLVDIRKINPDVPEDLAKIIMKTCAVSPDARYQTAKELETVFGRFSQGLVADRRDEDRPTDEDYQRKTKKTTVKTAIGSAILAALATVCFIMMPKDQFKQWVSTRTRVSSQSEKDSFFNSLASSTSDRMKKWLAKSSDEILHAKKQPNQKSKTKVAQSSKYQTRPVSRRSRPAKPKAKATKAKVQATRPRRSQLSDTPRSKSPAKRPTSQTSHRPHAKQKSATSPITRPIQLSLDAGSKQVLDVIQSSSLSDDEKAKSELTLQRFFAAIANSSISPEQADQRVNLLTDNRFVADSELNVLKVEEKRIRTWLKLIRGDVARLGNAQTENVPMAPAKHIEGPPKGRSKEELLQILLNGNLNDL